MTQAEPEISPIRRLRLWLFVLVSVPLSLLSGCNDFVYAVFGQTVDAKVISAQRVAPPKNKSIDVRYAFRDPNLGERYESDNIGASWEMPGETVRIEYLPGWRDWSRVKGQLTLFLYFLMLIGVVAVILAGVFAWAYYFPDSKHKGPIPDNHQRFLLGR